MSCRVSNANAPSPVKKRLRSSIKGCKPQLTSLVDVMTILLIYLLKSFSSEGEIVTVSKELQLPESSALKRPELTVTMVVNNTMIMVENVRVGDVPKIMESDSLIIPQLHEWLRVRRESTEKISKYSTSTSFQGKITIQGDKRIRFRLLKKIM